MNELLPFFIFLAQRSRRYVADFHSESTKKKYSLYLSDFFKNCRDGDGDKYKGVLPAEDAMEAVKKDGGANVVLFDPPYVKSQSGHTVLNSKSLARKSFVYGIDYTYSEIQILFFYVNCFALAMDVLVDGGFLIMKAMDGAQFPLTSFIEQCAGLFGYVRVGVPQKFPSSSNGSQKESVLLVFSKSKAGLLTFIDKKSTVRQQIVDDHRERAIGGYLASIKRFRVKRDMWKTGLDLIFSHREGCREDFLGRILSDFPGLLESSNLAGDGEGAGVLNDTADIEAVQRYAVKMRMSTLAAANVFGICFASLLKTYQPPCRVLELKEKVAIMKRVGFSDPLVKTLTGAPVGLENLHSNVVVLKNLLTKKRKAEESGARERGVKQQKLNTWLGRSDI